MIRIPKLKVFSLDFSLLSNAGLPETNPLLLDQDLDSSVSEDFQKMLNEWENHIGSLQVRFFTWKHFFFFKKVPFHVFFSFFVFWYSRRRFNGTIRGLRINVLNNPNNLKCDLKTSWQCRGSASKSAAASITNDPWWKSWPVQDDFRTNGFGWNSDQFWPWWPFWNLWRLIWDFRF